MDELLPILTVGFVAFLATNADNLILLFAFLADRSFRPRHVVIGYGLGMVIILGVSWLIAWIAHLFPPKYVGFLGVVPIVLGFKRLYDQFIRHRNPKDAAPAPPSTHSQIITVALADVAHGPDTITLYAALLAESDLAAQFAVTLLYLLLAAGWCCLGFFLLRHPRIRDPVQRYGNALSPFMLIGIGIYIILNTVHDVSSQ
ncbi:MAG TPA: cadmium resistance transporter [Candidatus Udaeobacter sp.]|jgi:cadmium resistance protein CadD (predicted permease)